MHVDSGDVNWSTRVLSVDLHINQPDKDGEYRVEWEIELSVGSGIV